MQHPQRAGIANQKGNHMKNWVGGLAAIAALMFSTGAMAQSYLSVAAGQGHQELDCTGATSCDSTGTALKVVGGYTFGQGVSLEVGYLDFGKIKASNGMLSVEIKSSALTLGGAYKLAFTPDFAGHLRLGVASMKAEAKATTFFGNFNDSETKAKLYYGLGLSYAFSNAVSAEIGADFSQAELQGDKADVRAVTAGLRFTF
jgi:OOP family OmpA-OmpF porin